MRAFLLVLLVAAVVGKHNFNVTNFGQTEPHRCGSDHVMENFYLTHPDEMEMTSLQRYALVTAKMALHNRQHGVFDRDAGTGILRVPVVWHVLRDAGVPSTDVPLSAINQEMVWLNDWFTATNIYYNDVPFDTIFADDIGTPVDYNVVFELAAFDPNGIPFSGVEYKDTSVGATCLEDDIFFTANGGIDLWDSLQYMNVYTCDLSTAAGYAFLPGSTTHSKDGMVLRAELMGNTEVSGSIISHEMGHWLGLKHTFSGCAAPGDSIDDTPPTDEPAFDWNTALLGPCAGVNGAVESDFVRCSNIVQVQNNMDYNFELCKAYFTKDQAAVMNGYLLAPNTIRSFLSSSPGLAATCGSYDCTGKTCGSDGCGGCCGECNPFYTCDGTQNCVITPQPEWQCDFAVVVNPTLSPGDIYLGENTGSTPTAASCEPGTIQHPIWYTFDATVDMDLEVNTFGSALDTTLSLFQGGCSTRTCIGFNDDFNYAGGVYTSQIIMSITGGNTYLVAVGGYSTSQGSYQITFISSVAAASPSPSVSPSRTNSGTTSESPTITTSVTDTPSRTPSVTDTPSRTPSVTDSSTISVTSSVTDTPSRTPSVTDSSTPSRTPTTSESPSKSDSSSRTNSGTTSESPSKSDSPSRTRTATISETPSRTPSVTDSSTPSRTPTTSESPSKSDSPSRTRSATITETPSRTSSITTSATSSITLGASASTSETPSATLSNTASRTAPVSRTPSRSSSVTDTPSQTNSGSITETPSVTDTPSATDSRTSSISPPVSPSVSASRTGSITLSATSSLSIGTSQSNTASRTDSASRTDTASRTASRTASGSVSESASLSLGVSESNTPSRSNSKSVTSSISPPVSPSVSASRTGSITSSATSSLSTGASQSNTASRTDTASRTASISASESASLSMGTSPSSSTTRSTSASSSVSSSTAGASASSTHSRSASTSSAPSRTATQSKSTGASDSVSTTVTAASSTSLVPSLTATQSKSTDASESASRTAVVTTSISSAPSLSSASVSRSRRVSESSILEPSITLIPESDSRTRTPSVTPTESPRAINVDIDDDVQNDSSENTGSVLIVSLVLLGLVLLF